jgi:hypothetical protein
VPNCNLCHSDFPNWVIIDNKRRNLKNRKYCLSCSNFGKHNTKRLHQQDYDQIKKNCPKCKKTKDSYEFYKRRAGANLSSYCKECTKNDAVNRARKLKIQCIVYKGGCCEKCGYNKCPAALEFHHSDPNKKDFTLSKRKFWKWCEAIKNELSKCELLCSNCHREIHHEWEEKGLTKHLLQVY